MPSPRWPGLGNPGIEEARVGNEKRNDSDPIGTKKAGMRRLSMLKPATPLRRMRGTCTVKLLVLIPVVLVLLLLLVVGFYEGRKAYWDSQVREMCEKDGGVRAYEAVRLPAAEYDQLQRSNWTLPNQLQAQVTDPYFYVAETERLRKSDPTIVRMHTRIFRRADGKVLGEIVRFSRGGGDLPGPWHPTSFTCPDPLAGPYLESSIFQKGK